MTSVNYSKENGEHRLQIDGHAGYSYHGSDIVCAAISAISYALLGYLENHDEENPNFSYATGNGSLLVYSGSSEQIDAAFDMAIIGFQQISNKYPQYVDVYISAIGGDSRV